jgi:hypothetical protein
MNLYGIHFKTLSLCEHSRSPTIQRFLIQFTGLIPAKVVTETIEWFDSVRLLQTIQLLEYLIKKSNEFVGFALCSRKPNNSIRGRGYRLVSCLVYSLTLKLEAICPSETSVFLRTTRRFNPDNSIRPIRLRCTSVYT